jgi:hypothetical protein
MGGVELRKISNSDFLILAIIKQNFTIHVTRETVVVTAATMRTTSSTESQ